MGQLAGTYASTFSDSYVTPLGPVLQRQHSLAAVLAIALEGEREVWLRADRNLSSIKYKALKAIKAAGPKQLDPLHRPASAA